MYGLVCLWYDIDVWLGMFVVCIYGCMGWCVCGMYVDVWVGVLVVCMDVWVGVFVVCM